MTGLIVGINFEDLDFDRKAAVDRVMDDFDTSRNGVVEEQEFVMGMKRWLDKAKISRPAGVFTNKFIDDYYKVLPLYS
jgi:hypothetical protein